MTNEQIRILVFDVLSAVCEKMGKDVPSLAQNSTFRILSIIIKQLAIPLDKPLVTKGNP